MPFPAHILPKSFTFDQYPRWGDVYWHDFGLARAGQHTMAEPHLAIVVSDTAATLRGTVEIVPLSGAEHKKPGYEFHVPITRTDCPQLDKDSIAKVDQVYCVPVKPGLPDQYFLARLSVRVMKRVYEKMLRALGVNYVLEGRLI